MGCHSTVATVSLSGMNSSPEKGSHRAKVLCTLPVLKTSTIALPEAMQLFTFEHFSIWSSKNKFSTWQLQGVHVSPVHSLYPRSSRAVACITDAVSVVRLATLPVGIDGSSRGSVGFRPNERSRVSERRRTLDFAS
jgi:hypothetical protein